MSTTAKITKAKAKLLRLTSRAKSPKPPAKKVQAAPATTDLKATLQAAVEAVTAVAPIVPGLDGDAGTPAEQIGEPVQPKAKAKKSKAPAATSDKGEALLALLTRPEGATVRQSLDATGWSHSAVKRHVTNVIRKQLGYRIDRQRAPKETVDPADRAHTMFVYRAVKA
jgi:uncharacterized membrane protein YdfJ with MMPL/SSD domain